MNLRIVLLLVTLLNFFLPLGFTPLFDLDEGAFSEATREMLKSGNYLTTYLDGHLRFDKPILIYWLQASSVKLFGLNEFALRFPSALAATIWAWSLWFFSRRFFNEKVAFYAVLAMLGALQVNIIAKAAIADALLNLFIALSLFSVWLYIESKKVRFLYLAFAAIAFGTLAKGPVAILIPLATTSLYMLIQRDIKGLLKMLFNPVGIAIFLSISMPWYILEYLDQGQKFIDGFFLKHNLERFSKSLESHGGSYFYYIPVLLVGFLPFTTPLLKALYRIKNNIKEPLFLYLFIWFAFVFLFFSLSGTKLPHYIIYGYTPLFIFIGHTMAHSKKPLGWLFLIPTIIALVLFALFPYFINFLEPKSSYYTELFAAAKEYFDLQFQLFAILITAIIILLTKSRLQKEIKVALIALLFTLFINLKVIGTYGNLAQVPIKEAALFAKKRNLNIIMYHFTRPSFLLYLEKQSLKKEPDVGDFVFTNRSSLPKFKKYSVQYSKNGVYLIKVEK